MILHGLYKGRLQNFSLPSSPNEYRIYRWGEVNAFTRDYFNDVYYNDIEDFIKLSFSDWLKLIPHIKTMDNAITKD